MGAFFLSVAVAVPILAAVVLLVRRTGGWRTRSREVAIVAGIVYGIWGRFLFGLSYAEGGHLASAAAPFSVMSVSFLFLVPLAIGFLEESMPDPARPRTPYPWLRAFFGPTWSVLVMLGIMVAFSIEGTICVVMALPVFLVLAGLGGLVGHLVRRNADGKARTGMISAVVLLPYVASPVEDRLLEATSETREVENTVRIRADADTVWQEVKSVRAIAPSELPFRFSHLIGLPRPIEATLSADELGGVRIATFERGLAFRETVTHWEPGQSLAFAIRAERAPKAALDEHVSVGGPYFDVLDGRYDIQRAPDGTTLLRLTSHQRLSTRFNFYARWWTDFVMSDLQSAIMEVIRTRAERSRQPRGAADRDR